MLPAEIQNLTEMTGKLGRAVCVFIICWLPVAAPFGGCARPHGGIAVYTGSGTGSKIISLTPLKNCIKNPRQKPKVSLFWGDAGAARVNSKLRGTRTQDRQSKKSLEPRGVFSFSVFSRIATSFDDDPKNNTKESKSRAEEIHRQQVHNRK